MKKIVALVLAAVIILAAVPAKRLAGLDLLSTGAKAELNSSGKCGENVYYTFDETTGTLVISGEGDMVDGIFDMTPFSYNCPEVKNIIIENGVTSISVNAFYGCSNLKNVTIPDSVTHIGQAAFLSTAFENDLNNWENGILYIGNHLIEAKRDVVEKCTIRPGTKTIAESAFSSCKKLMQAAIPGSVTHINSGAFYGCTSLADVVIPEGVQDIDFSAFLGCESLEEIVIPTSVIKIGDGAFSDCSRLRSITIPDSVMFIGQGIVSGTEYSSNPDNWENGILYIGNHIITAYSSISGDYKIKSGIKSVASYAFTECEELTGIEFPESLVGIGQAAFYNLKKLTCITIPENVKCIGAFAFSGCDNIKDVYYSGTEEQWDRIEIESGNECLINATIHFEKNTGFFDIIKDILHSTIEIINKAIEFFVNLLTQTLKH